MALVPSRLQGFERPGERVGVTAWRQLLAADLASEANTALKSSIADSGGEIQYVGAAHSGSAFQLKKCYQAIFTIINPDTGATVDWSDGQCRRRHDLDSGQSCLRDDLRSRTR